MADPSKEVLLLVLAACAGPMPLYPAGFAQANGFDRNQLDDVLDRLRISGLVRLTEWTEGLGQGYAVTPNGELVLRNPGLLHRQPTVAPDVVTRPANLPLSTWERGEAVRGVLLDPVRPTFTMGLLFLNVLLFMVGLAIAWRGGFAEAYFGGGLQMDGGAAQQKIGEVVEATNLRFLFGALDTYTVLRFNAWWRLLAYAFIHIGFLHILLNMMALYNLGPLLETMWGHGRFLYLYLVSAVTGGCVVLLGDVNALTAGASGAICGLLASMGAWLILNRGYLPPELTRRWLNQVFLNIVLIGFLSTLPGVSWQGHLGGFVGGAIVSLPLNAHRFGSGLSRAAGFLGLCLIPVASVVVVLYMNYPEWEAERFKARFISDIIEVEKSAVATYNQLLSEIKKPNEGELGRDTKKRQDALTSAARVQTESKTLVDEISAAGPYRNERNAADIADLVRYLESWSDMIRFMEAGLSPEAKGKPNAAALAERSRAVAELQSKVVNAGLLRDQRLRKR